MKWRNITNFPPIYSFGWIEEWFSNPLTDDRMFVQFIKFAKQSFGAVVRILFKRMNNKWALHYMFAYSLLGHTLRMPFFVKFVASSSLMVSSQIRTLIHSYGEKINIKKLLNVSRQTRADVYMLPDQCKWQMHSRAFPILYSTVQCAGNILIGEENTCHTYCLLVSVMRGYNSFWRKIRSRTSVVLSLMTCSHPLYAFSRKKSRDFFCRKLNIKYTV